MNRIIGIMGAMPEETKGVVELLTGVKKFTTGKRVYYTGQINDTDAVVVFSRWGKVAAASTAATLIHRFNVDSIIFTGVAGAIKPGLKTGDIVIGKRLIQHDLDGRPLIQKNEIPLLGKTYLETDPLWLSLAEQAVGKMLSKKNLRQIIDPSAIQKLNLTDPDYYIGDIASGDQFFYMQQQKSKLLKALPDIYCVEMEGAAVAQVCYENNKPALVVRTISDDADEHSPIDFTAFIENVASIYSKEIIKNIFEHFQVSPA